MKIGIDISHAVSPQKTGVGWYSYNIVRALSETDSHNEYVLYCRNFSKDSFFALPKNMQIKALFWPFPRMWSQARLSGELCFAQLDAFFAPSYMAPFFSPKNTAVTVHDLAFKLYPEAYSAFSRFLQHETIMRAIQTGAKIITPSHFTKNELIKYYPKVSAERVFPIHHGADEGIFNRAEECSTILKKYALDSFPYVLFLGRIERKKNILNLVRAFEAVAGEMKDVRLVLAGVPGIGYSEIAAYIQHSAYAGRVVEIGFVPREDVPALFSGAACFFYATLYEGFGLAIVEALSCGAPVIASLGAPFEEVGGDACVYADKDNPQDIAEKMMSIVENPRLRDNLKQKGMARAREFTWAECAKKTLSVLER